MTSKPPKVLLHAGARIDDAGSDGTNPLVYAIVSGQAAFAHFLLEQGADPNGAIDGTTALHAAAGDVDTWLKAWNRRHGGGGPYYLDKPRIKLEERLPLVKALLAKGAKVNARTTSSEMIAGGFLRNGAYDNFTIGTGDVSGATPLWVASYSMNGGGGFGGTRPANVVRSTGEILRTLLAAGADPNLRTVDGTTPLMAAAGCGWSTYTPGKPRADRRPTAEEAVRILVEEAHSTVNTVNEAEFTPLHCAAFSGLNEVVQFLVDRGAALNARDWRGRTPFRLAEGAKQNFQFQDWPATAQLLPSAGSRHRPRRPGHGPGAAPVDRRTAVTMSGCGTANNVGKAGRMARGLLAVSLAWVALSAAPHSLSGAVAGARTQAAAQPAAAAEPAARALFDQYCVTCHNERLKTAGLMLDKIDLATGQRAFGNAGEGGPQADERADAAARPAAPRPRRRGQHRVRARGGA